MVIIVMLWIMLVFIMDGLRVRVGRVALILNAIMTKTLNTWKTYQRGSLLSSNCKNENTLYVIRIVFIFSFS